MGGKAEPTEPTGPALQQDDYHKRKNIRFIGVWDTVSAMGGPFPWAADIVNVLYRYKWASLELGPQVEHACHALSIDDKRRTFHPLLWHKGRWPPADVGEQKRGDRLEQVWFVGAHADVGGGYPKDQVAGVSFAWMMQRAKAHGLELTFDPSERKHMGDVFGRVNNSRAGLKSFYRYAPRDIEKICRKADVWPVLHLSCLERIKRGTEGYAPSNVPARVKFVRDSKKERTLPKAIKLEIDQSKRKQANRLVAWRLFVYWALFCTSLAAIAGLVLTLSGKTAWWWPGVGNASWFWPAACGIALLVLIALKREFENRMKVHGLDAWSAHRSKAERSGSTAT